MLSICLRVVYCLILVALIITALEWYLLETAHIDLFREGVKEVFEVFHP